MINNKKILIFVVSLSMLYFLISIIYIIPRGKKYDKTVFLDSVTKVSLKDGKINTYNEDAKIRKQNVKIYFKGNFVDGYIISGEGTSSGVNNYYYVYSDKNEYYAPKDILIAHTLDVSIDVKDSIQRESTRIDEIIDFINSGIVDLSEYLELDYLSINTIDIDDDGLDEYIYSVGLIESEETESVNVDKEYFEDEEDEIDYTEEDEDINNKYISIVYIKTGDRIILIDNIESEGNIVSFEKLFFSKLIDFNKDGNYEFVVEKMMSEYGPSYYELYNFDGSKFTKIGGE